MSTLAFKQAKKIGRQFEHQVFQLLREQGCYEIDTDKMSYTEKKGCDCYIKLLNPDGSFKRDERGYVICQPVEVKLDKLSEATGQVYIEQEALDKSISHFWVYGLPQSSKIDLYSVMLRNLKEFAPNLGKAVLGGEYRSTGYLIPKEVFTSQSWVTRWKTINLYPYKRNSTRQPNHSPP
jgi:hypothetical protein